MKKPSVIHWALTSRCNLKCGFCFAYNGNELNTKRCFKIIDIIKPLGIKKLVITGGEPLIRKDIIKIVNYAAKKGFNIRLDTNGILLPKFINRLKINSFGISLDGPDPKTDQLMRQHPKHFENVIKSLEKLKKTNKKVIIHTLATKLNYKKIPEMTKILEKYKIFKWDIFEFCPYARGFKNRKKYQITPGQFETMKRKIKYKGQLDFCRINNRVKAYFFITSDGQIYTQPKKYSANYPVWGSIFEKNPEDFFKDISLAKNKKRSLVY
jgi:MoaA/NifB/PqqE/SkfB family radical SAM enzyme